MSQYETTWGLRRQTHCGVKRDGCTAVQTSLGLSGAYAVRAMSMASIEQRNQASIEQRSPLQCVPSILLALQVWKVVDDDEEHEDPLPPIAAKDAKGNDKPITDADNKARLKEQNTSLLRRLHRATVVYHIPEYQEVVDLWGAGQEGLIVSRFYSAAIGVE